MTLNHERRINTATIIDINTRKLPERAEITKEFRSRQTSYSPVQQSGLVNLLVHVFLLALLNGDHVMMINRELTDLSFIGI